MVASPGSLVQACTGCVDTIQPCGCHVDSRHPSLLFKDSAATCLPEGGTNNNAACAPVHQYRASFYPPNLTHFLPAFLVYHQGQQPSPASLGQHTGLAGPVLVPTLSTFSSGAPWGSWLAVLPTPATLALCVPTMCLRGSFVSSSISSSSSERHLV